jgi:hypothetical protein
MDLTLVIGIAEIVGGIAIVGSLIYVGLQVDQNTRVARASANQAVTEQMREATTLLIADPGLLALVKKGEQDPEALSEAEWDRFVEFVGLRFVSFETTYYSNQKGLLDAEMFDAWDNYFRTLIKMPGYVAAYRRNPEGFMKSFANYIETLIED